MRLEKELGALNSEIITIREKWKIALNVEKKKTAIERLITFRHLRDKEEISNMINSVVEKEHKDIEKKIKSDLENLENRVKTASEISQIEEILTPEKSENIENKVIEISSDNNIEFKNKSIDEFPAHLTVSWLKQRLLKQQEN